MSVKNTVKTMHPITTAARSALDEALEVVVRWEGYSDRDRKKTSDPIFAQALCARAICFEMAALRAEIHSSETSVTETLSEIRAAMELIAERMGS